MLETLKKVLGLGHSIDYAQLIKQGAIVLDVRTKDEFSGGHIKGAMNIPVNQLADHFQKIPDKRCVIITCCASGMRSASAERLLRSHGYENVVNGGGWTNLQSKIK